MLLSHCADFFTWSIGKKYLYEAFKLALIFAFTNSKVTPGHRIKDARIEKVRFLIRLPLKVALPYHIEESSSRQEGRASSRRQIV